MKILLLTHGRSGSQSIQFALGDMMNHDTITEPFNDALWENHFEKEPPFTPSDTIPENTIIRSMIVHNTYWHTEHVDDFDHVIILLRDDIRDTIKSSQHALTHNYHDPYIAESDTFVPQTARSVAQSYAMCCIFLAENPSTQVLWYNDVFTDIDTSYKTFKELGLDVTYEKFESTYDKYLDPKHRLRQ